MRTTVPAGLETSQYNLILLLRGGVEFCSLWTLKFRQSSKSFYASYKWSLIDFQVSPNLIRSQHNPFFLHKSELNFCPLNFDPKFWPARNLFLSALKVVSYYFFNFFQAGNKSAFYYLGEASKFAPTIRP